MEQLHEQPINIIHKSHLSLSSFSAYASKAKALQGLFMAALIQALSERNIQHGPKGP